MLNFSPILQSSTSHIYQGQNMDNEQQKQTYESPELSFLGDFGDLTLGSGGSQNDGVGGGAGMACLTPTPGDDGCG